MRSVAAVVLGVCLLIAQGCTAGVATQIQESIRPARAPTVGDLAVLPVTAELGSEEASPLLAGTAMEILARKLPSARIAGGDEVRRHLGSAGVASTLAQLLRDYEEAGAVDVERVDAVADALGVEHLLQLRVGFAETDVLRRDVLLEDVSDEQRREVVMVARLWSRGEPAPTWEASARAHAETGFPSATLPARQDMLRHVLEQLLEPIPALDLRGGEPSPYRFR